MERPVIKCNLCNSNLILSQAYGSWFCPNVGCSSPGGSTFNGSLTLGKLNELYESVKEGINTKPEVFTKTKTTPLTTDDILDIRKWSKEIKHHELHYLIRAKRRT